MCKVFGVFLLYCPGSYTCGPKSLALILRGGRRRRGKFRSASPDTSLTSYCPSSTSIIIYLYRSQNLFFDSRMTSPLGCLFLLSGQNSLLFCLIEGRDFLPLPEVSTATLSPLPKELLFENIEITNYRLLVPRKDSARDPQHHHGSAHTQTSRLIACPSAPKTKKANRGHSVARSKDQLANSPHPAPIR